MQPCIAQACPQPCVCLFDSSDLAWCVVPAAEGLVTAKGRLAAELNVGHDELVLTELILGGAFADLSPDALAALCSCFVWSERATVPPA